jgi:hypothetical protein
MRGRSLVDRLLRLYPRDWRDRYGDEVRDLVDELIEKGEFSPTRITVSLVVSALVQRVRSWRSSWRTVVVAATVCALVAVGLIVATGSRSGHSIVRLVAETKGTVPLPTNGKVNIKKTPDFIATLGHNGGIAGYIPRAYLFPVPNQPVKSGYIAPVYASNLKTLVGYSYPLVGFVALGQSPLSQPCTPGGEGVPNGPTSTIPCPSKVETVPNIIGLSQPTAMSQLSAVGFYAGISYMQSSTVPGGHVISVMPAPGTEVPVPARALLTVVISLSPGQTMTTPTYPSTVEIPNVIGLSLTTAMAQLRHIGMTTVVSHVHSSSVAAGHVISVLPAPGSKVLKGQGYMFVVISLGPG